MPSRRIHLLVNPIAGAGRASRTAARLEAVLGAAGHDARAVPTRGGSDRRWLRDAVGGAELVVVIGGDGAMRLAAHAALEFDVPMWHWPNGTENLVARSVGMRPDETLLLASIEAWRLDAIDIGLFRPGGATSPSPSPSPFLLMASVGFDACVVHDVVARRRGAISRLTYLVSILRMLGRWQGPELAISVDGGPQQPLGRGGVIVGNLPAFGLGIDPVRTADPRDGALDAVFLPGGGGPAALGWAIRWRLTSAMDLPGARRFRGRSLRIEVSMPTGVAADRRWQLDGDAAEVGPADGMATVDCTIADRRLVLLAPASRATGAR
jgi:diacylglycerol kinase family enzyme